MFTSRSPARFALILLLFGAAGLPAQQDDARLAAIEQGAQIYHSLCAVCHEESGDGIEGIDFARGIYKRASSDENFIRLVEDGIPGTAMPPFDLRRRQTENLLHYIRSLRETVTHSSAAGDAARGRALFEGKAECLNCHRVQNIGGRLGPSLTAIGGIRPASMLEQSILEPNAVVLSDHWFFRAVTRDGVTITGRRLNEDRNTLQLIDAKDRLVSLIKSELREYAVVKTSAMPAYQGKLNAGEVTDVVKYLTTLRGFEAPAAEASAGPGEH
jgi:putative heme-binding domain-containing protein